LHIRAFLAAAIAGFALAPGARAGTERVIHAFCEEGQPCRDGIGPDAPLLEDAAGNLYGSTFDGGIDGGGVVFRLVPDGRKFDFKVLFRFTGGDGATPTARLIIDTIGNLYGMTPFGGDPGDGVVFELVRSADGSKFTPVTLHDFCTAKSCADGANPFGGLAYAGQQTGAPYDGTSPLYGTTSQGGASDAGVAFQLNSVRGKTTRKLKVIYNFCSQTNCSDGGYGDEATDSGLVIDANGNLFGNTEAGGNAENAGVIFELSPKGKQFGETVLYTFCSLTDCADGAAPRAAPALDAQGNLFGTTEYGGAYNGTECQEFTLPGCGTVFEVHGARYTVLHSFCADYPACSDGYMPLADVTADANGNIFGVAATGGAGNSGTAFRLHGKSFTLLHSFCTKPDCTDGNSPLAGMILDPAGRLYGTTYGGGLGLGIVFELKP
jgi:uncharacterized repeat protein (TIGR03803 family)